MQKNSFHNHTYSGIDKKCHQKRLTNTPPTDTIIVEINAPRNDWDVRGNSTITEF